ncbi:hypothetical protein L1887_51894 [Cichorium endivia]|nr:hypothetical protein L1887_51894 [Cichorium endivia]
MWLLMPAKRDPERTGRLAVLLDSIEILLHRCGRVCTEARMPTRRPSVVFSQGQGRIRSWRSGTLSWKACIRRASILSTENTGRENMIFRNSFSEPTPTTHTKRPQIHAPSLPHTLSASITLLFFESRCLQVRLALVGREDEKEGVGQGPADDGEWWRRGS